MILPRCLWVTNHEYKLSQELKKNVLHKVEAIKKLDKMLKGPSQRRAVINLPAKENSMWKRKETNHDTKQEKHDHSPSRKML
jgi:hypothetical protein